GGGGVGVRAGGINAPRPPQPPPPPPAPPPPAPLPALTSRGTPYPWMSLGDRGGNTGVAAGGGGNNGAILSGTVTLTAGGPTNPWLYGGTVPPGTMTLQYYLDGKPISPQIQDFTNANGG